MKISSSAQRHFTNPVSITSQFPFCGLPLRLDTYAGCAFRCSYCFARYRAEATFGSDYVRPANPETIKKIFRFAIDLERFPEGVVAQCLRRRMPIHFGGMSDGFQPAERKHRVTEAALRVLARYQYPTVISTRGVLVAESPYIDLLRAIGAVVVQFSFSTTKDSVARVVEPYATPPSLLLQTMETLAAKGITVTCRWQPYIPGVSEAPDEFVSKVVSAGARHIALEHLKLAMEKEHPLWRQLTRSVGGNPYDEFAKRGMRRDGREYVLLPEAKLDIILETARLARLHGVSFGSADNEFQYLSDSACCCSGVDQFLGFENWFKHQIGYAVRQCRGKKITYGSIAREWIPSGSVDWYVNPNSRLSARLGRKATMKDHIKAKWDSLIAPGSPSSFYGVRCNPSSKECRRTYLWDLPPQFGES
jgi:DNA repair photolyase